MSVAASAPAPSLRQALLKGSAWTLVTLGLTQIIRFGRSLILTRLLAPQVYGVMAIVWALLTSIALLSDVGFAPCIVRSPRGDDPDFLNTAWTMKVIRGLVMFLVSVAIAYPASRIYNEPALTALIAVTGLTSIIDGLGSTSAFTVQRSMSYRGISLLKLGNEFAGPLITIIWAVFDPSPWAMVAGGIAGSIFLTVGSHRFLPGIRNQFRWDKTAFAEITDFGKWIFLSSAIYVLYSQGDRLLIGKYVDPTALGIFSIAAVLGTAISGTINQLTDSVLFPALSQTVNKGAARLKEVLYKTRLGMDALLITPTGILLVTGNLLVSTIYDHRYHEAGWMFQFLCVRLIMLAMVAAGGSSLVALGHARYAVTQNICRGAWIVVGVPLGWKLCGMKGVLLALASIELPVFFVVWRGMAKHKILSLKLELRSLLFAGIGIAIGFGVLEFVHK